MGDEQGRAEYALNTSISLNERLSNVQERHRRRMLREYDPPAIQLYPAADELATLGQIRAQLGDTNPFTFDVHRSVGGRREHVQVTIGKRDNEDIDVEMVPIVADKKSAPTKGVIRGPRSASTSIVADGDIADAQIFGIVRLNDLFNKTYDVALGATNRALNLRQGGVKV